MKWTLVESKYILKDKWISLRADTCKTNSGRIIEPYYVLEYPALVNIMAINNNNEVLLVKQYRHGIGKTLLGLPSGTVDKNDISPLSAAKRELLEETGYTSNNIIETGVLPVNPANLNNVTHCFLATDLEDGEMQKTDATEELELVAMPLSDLLTMIEGGDEFQALHVASIWLALKKLGVISINID